MRDHFDVEHLRAVRGTPKIPNRIREFATAAFWERNLSIGKPNTKKRSLSFIHLTPRYQGAVAPHEHDYVGQWNDEIAEAFFPVPERHDVFVEAVSGPRLQKNHMFSPWSVMLFHSQEVERFDEPLDDSCKKLDRIFNHSVAFYVDKKLYDQGELCFVVDHVRRFPGRVTKPFSGNGPRL